MLGIAGGILLLAGFVTFLGGMLAMMSGSMGGMQPGLGPTPALPLGRLLGGMLMLVAGGIALKLAWGAGLLGVAGQLSDSPKHRS